MMRPIGYLEHATSSASTWNPSDKATNIALSGGNLIATKNTDDKWVSVRGTTSKSATKVYFEITDVSGGSTSTPNAGVANASMPLQGAGQCYVGFDNNGIGFGADGSVRINGILIVNTFDAWQGAGDVARFAINLATMKAWFGTVASGIWNGSGGADPVTGVGGIDISGLNAGPYFVAGSLFYGASSTNQIRVNFGASPFSASVPAGFSPWG